MPIPQLIGHSLDCLSRIGLRPARLDNLCDDPLQFGIYAKVVPTLVNPPPSQGDRVYAVDLLLRNCRKIEIPRRSVVFAKIPT